MIADNRLTEIASWDDRLLGEQLAHMAPVHADEVESAVHTVPGEEPEGARQELGELVLVHLARGHREFAMVDRTKPADMAIDRHIVWRIGEDHGGPVRLHQDTVRRLVERAAANRYDGGRGSTGRQPG